MQPTNCSKCGKAADATHKNKGFNQGFDQGLAWIVVASGQLSWLHIVAQGCIMTQ